MGRTSTRRSSVRNGIVKILVALLTISLTLFAVDRVLGARQGTYLSPLADPPFEAAEPNALGTYLRPGYEREHFTSEYSMYVRTNALGLRGPEIAVDRRPGSVRVLALGDSFTFGYGVDAERSWPARLAELARGRGVPVEVVNAGFSGFSPSGYLRYVREVGSRLDPDLIVVALFVGNDVLDEVVHERPDLTRAQRALIQARHFHADRGMTAGPLVEVRRLAQTLLPNLSELIVLARVKLLHALGGHRPTFDHVLDPDPPDEIRGGWDRLFSSLEAIQRIATHEGRALAAIIIPFHDQVTQARFDPTLVPDLPQQRISAFCERVRLRCLDLLPVLRAHARPNDLYYLSDGHWTHVGHQVAASALDEWLRSTGSWPLPR